MLIKYKKILICIIILVFAYVTFASIYLNLWGFYIRKTTINNLLIHTQNEGYRVDNKEKVLEIAKKLTKQRKLSRINGNFPPSKNNSIIRKLVLQTEDNTSYGGSFWIVGSEVWQESNGYYWTVSNDLLDSLNKLIQEEGMRFY